MAKLLAGAATDTGRVRDHNEDTISVADLDSEQVRERGFLIAVADGMGGHERGEVASQLAIETLFAQFYNHETPLPTPDSMAGTLQEAFQRANIRIMEEAVQGDGRSGSLGTTMVAAVVQGDNLTVANVGDSRAYLVRAERATQITKDHSLVAEQVASGVMTEEEAKYSNYRNVITRALGQRPKVEADIFELRLLPEDRVVLLSDGVHGSVEPDDIAAIVLEKAPQAASNTLNTLALDNGSADNVSTAIIVFDPATAADEPALVTAGSGSGVSGARGISPIVIFLLVIVVMAVILGVLFFTGILGI